MMLATGYPGYRYDKARKRVQAMMDAAPHSGKARSDLVVANEAVDLLPMLREANKALMPLAGISAADEARSYVCNVIGRLTEDLSQEPMAIGSVEKQQ